jgi:transposase
LAESVRQVRRGKRYERYQAVVELHHHGLGRRAIARQTGLSRNTVHRYLQAGTFPEQRVRPKRRSLLDPYLPYLRERWGAGCQNAAQLARELQDRGYRGSPTTLRALISDWRASSPSSARRTSGPKRTTPAPSRRRLSSRQASFLVVKQPEALAPTQQRYLEQICQASDELKRVYDLTQQFVSMVRQRQAEQLDAWLSHVKGQGHHELIGFASGIKRDDAAVRAGLSRVESNGQVEGQITRLKYLKRQMYGQAKFDLLRLRVLHAA